VDLTCTANKARDVTRWSLWIRIPWYSMVFCMAFGMVIPLKWLKWALPINHNKPQQTWGRHFFRQTYVGMIGETHSAFRTHISMGIFPQNDEEKTPGKVWIYVFIWKYIIYIWDLYVFSRVLHARKHVVPLCLSWNAYNIITIYII
jgi:hypothetical protein